MVRIQKHPIGFTKITLFSLFGRKVRIHYWPRGLKSSRPDIHDHRWSFLSIPLIGTFIEKRYKRVKGSNYLLRHCFSEPRDGPRSVKTVGKGSVRESFHIIRKPFRPYTCPASVVHSHAPQSTGKHLSLVITWRPVREYAEVWHEPGKKYSFYN